MVRQCGHDIIHKMASTSGHRRSSSVTWSDARKNKTKNRLSISFTFEQKNYLDEIKPNICDESNNNSEQIQFSVVGDKTVVGSVNVNNSGISVDAGLQTNKSKTNVILSLSSEIPLPQLSKIQEENNTPNVPLKRTTSVGLLFDISKDGASIKKTGSKMSNSGRGPLKARSTPTSEDEDEVTEIVGLSFQRLNPTNLTHLNSFASDSLDTDTDDGHFVLHKQQQSQAKVQTKNRFSRTLSQIINFHKEKKKSESASSSEKSPLPSPRVLSSHQIKTNIAQCATNHSNSSSASSSGDMCIFQIEENDPYGGPLFEPLEPIRTVDPKSMKKLKKELKSRKLLIDKKQIDWIGDDGKSTPCFETARKIGEGGFSHVLLASFQGELVAVKKILVRDADYVFHNEVSIMLNIDTSQKNIISLRGVCLEERLIVLPYITGSTIADYITTYQAFSKKIPTKTAIKICLDIAKAFRYLHACRPRIIHRDLKSSNVLHQIDKKTNNLQVFLCDFGISRKELNGKGNPENYTWIGHHCYKAPEVRKHLPYNYKVDVFAFGTFLYEVVCTSLLEKEQVPPLLDACNLSNIRQDIKKLIIECWSDQPCDRPSFATICSKLKRILSKLKK